MRISIRVQAWARARVWSLCVVHSCLVSVEHIPMQAACLQLPRTQTEFPVAIRIVGPTLTEEHRKFSEPWAWVIKGTYSAEWIPYETTIYYRHVAFNSVYLEVDDKNGRYRIHAGGKLRDIAL